MESALYCHPVDVFRVFNPQLTENTLDEKDFIGHNDREQILAAIEDVCSEFEDKTRHALRQRRQGSPGLEGTWEHQEPAIKSARRPIRVNLDHKELLPLDSSQGDALEVRTSRDSWRPILDEGGDTYELDRQEGVLTLYRRITRRLWVNGADDRYVRTTYRYGGLGGKQSRGGQTTLVNEVDSSTTTITVKEPGRLYSGILLIGNSEYVRVKSVDYDTGELTVSRGRRATTEKSHDAGDVVHYCPANARKAVAQKAATELLTYDNWVDELVDIDGVQAQRKLDEWNKAFDQLCAKHSGVRKL